MEYEKDFDGWHPVKKGLDERTVIPTFRRREIWWCSTGINVGVEQDGKNHHYERPVLVVCKFNRRLFWGIPLSTQIFGKLTPQQFETNYREYKRGA